MKKIPQIILLSGLIYFLQSIEGITNLGLSFYFKDTLKLTPEKIMWIGCLISSAWIVKPIYGICVDGFGSKKAWISGSILFSLIITILIGGLYGLNAYLFIPLMILSGLTFAIRDVATDGLCCEVGKKQKITGKIQASQSIITSITAIFVGLIGGYLSVHYKYNIAFLLLTPVYILAFLFALNYKEQNVNKKSFILEITKFRNILKDSKVGWICLFIFLWVYSPGFGTPLFFKETNVFLWSGQFLGILQAISALFSIVAGVLYYKISKKIDIRKWLYASVFIGSLITFSYLYYTPITAIIYDCLFSFIGTIIGLSMMDWMSQNTVRGMEATSFALLASVYNLANTAGAASGAFLYPIIGLNNLIIISGCVSLSSLLVIKKVVK
jgi:MFS family permease